MLVFQQLNVGQTPWWLFNVLRLSILLPIYTMIRKEVTMHATLWFLHKLSLNFANWQRCLLTIDRINHCINSDIWSVSKESIKCFKIFTYLSFSWSWVKKLIFLLDKWSSLKYFFVETTPISLKLLWMEYSFLFALIGWIY